jgi:hypothetical protein
MALKKSNPSLMTWKLVFRKTCFGSNVLEVIHYFEIDLKIVVLRGTL